MSTQADPVELRRRAELLLGHGRLDDARRELGDAIVRAPEDPQVWRLLAVLERRSGDTGAALRAVDHAQGLGLDPADAWTIRLTIHYFARRLAEAVAAGEQVLALVPDSAYAHTMIAQMLGEAGREPDRAVAHGQHAVALAPDDAHAHYALGMASRGRGTTWGMRAAEPALRTAARLDPTDAATLNALGLVDLGLNRPARALRSFAGSLALDPEQQAAAHNTRLALWGVLVWVNVGAGLVLVAAARTTGRLVRTPVAVQVAIGVVLLVGAATLAAVLLGRAFPPALRPAARSALRRDPVLRPSLASAACTTATAALVLALPVRDLGVLLAVLGAGVLAATACWLVAASRMRRLRRRAETERGNVWVGLGRP